MTQSNINEIQKLEHDDVYDVKKVSNFRSDGSGNLERDDGTVKIIDGNTGNEVSIQYPLSTDGDSVYCKDIDKDNSDIGDFSGEICDLVNDLKSLITNTTSDNPKSIKLWFNRTIYAHDIGLGCDNLSKGFGTDVTIKLLGSGEVVRFSKNFTGLDPNSALFEFGPKAFNGIILEFNTSDEVCLSNLTIRKAIESTTTVQATDPDGNITNIGATKEKALKVAIEDQHFRPISLRMNQVVQEGLTLAEDTVIDSRTITVSPGHGLVATDRIILLQENGEPQFFFSKIISVAGDVLTLDTLVPYAFQASIAEITQYDPDLNKDGSTTVYKAELRNPFSFSIDVTRIIMHMTDATAMDDGKFGGRTALDYGISFRKNIPGSGNIHLWNCKTNGEIGELSFDKEYDFKAPAGVYGFSSRLTYAGQSKHGVAILLEQGEAIELLIQDDLTELVSFTIMVEGHFNE